MECYCWTAPAAHLLLLLGCYCRLTATAARVLLLRVCYCYSSATAVWLLLLQDPEETDAWAGFKKIGEKLLNFGGVKQPKVSVCRGQEGLVVGASRACVTGKHSHASCIQSA